jgi:23S rRNA (cytosine1962-C5)-methyltransferase
MQIKSLRLKKNQDRRLRSGHIWIYSNEVDTAVSPIKSFIPGEEVIVESQNGTILGIAYVNPQSLIMGRLFTRNSEERLNLPFFCRHIEKALALRTRLFNKPFYRLVYGESDNLPGLIADRFGDVLVIQLNTAGMDAKKDIILAAFLQVIPELQSILFKNDSSARKPEGLESTVVAGFNTPPEKITLEENNVLFQAPLWLGQKTSWFYDHRSNRLRQKEYVEGKRVLDVFSYLGGWGIQAAVFGAASVTCIDSSKLSAEWIRENALLNNVSEKISVITDDAFDALKKLHQTKEKYDVIILDPPAFIKKQKDMKEGLLAYQRINEAALKLLSPGGILMSCSCSMHLSYGDLVESLRRAAYRNEMSLQILERGHQGPDHPVHLAIPETDYLKMVVVRKL